MGTCFQDSDTVSAVLSHGSGAEIKESGAKRQPPALQMPPWVCELRPMVSLLPTRRGLNCDAGHTKGQTRARSGSVHSSS